MRGVVYDGNDYQVVDDLSVRDPGPGEVVVGIKAAGLCHSDLSVITGTIPFPTPVVLGHEGAGVVEAVGPNVKNVKEGDHVVLSTLGNCGACQFCDAVSSGTSSGMGTAWLALTTVRSEKTEALAKA